MNSKIVLVTSLLSISLIAMDSNTNNNAITPYKNQKKRALEEDSDSATQEDTVLIPAYNNLPIKKTAISHPIRCYYSGCTQDSSSWNERRNHIKIMHPDADEKFFLYCFDCIPAQRFTQAREIYTHRKKNIHRNILEINEVTNHHSPLNEQDSSSYKESNEKNDQAVPNSCLELNTPFQFTPSFIAWHHSAQEKITCGYPGCTRYFKSWQKRRPHLKNHKDTPNLHLTCFECNPPLNFKRSITLHKHRQVQHPHTLENR